MGTIASLAAENSRGFYSQVCCTLLYVYTCILLTSTILFRPAVKDKYDRFGRVSHRFRSSRLRGMLKNMQSKNSRFQIPNQFHYENSEGKRD